MATLIEHGVLLESAHGPLPSVDQCTVRLPPVTVPAVVSVSG